MSYTQKCNQALTNAGQQPMRFLHNQPDASLLQLSIAIQKQYIVEASPLFDTLTPEEKADHQKLCDAIRTAQDAAAKTYGDGVIEQLKLTAALNLAYPSIPKTAQQNEASGDGIYLYQFAELPLYFYDVRHNPQSHASLDLHDFSASAAIISAYENALARMKADDSAIPETARRAFQKLEIDPTPLLNQFVTQYQALVTRCTDILSPENQAFILETLPKEKRGAARQALDFLNNFPEKPTLRECDRFNELCRSHDSNPLPPYSPPSSTALQTAMYDAIISDITFANSEKLQQIHRSIGAAKKDVPKDSLVQKRTLTEMLDYFTIGYEKIAYPGKLATYRASNTQHQPSGRFGANANRNAARYNSLSTQDQERFSAYYRNKAAFESVADALLYHEPTDASVETLGHARAYLETIRKKTEEVVKAIEAAPHDTSEWEDEVSEFDIRHSKPNQQDFGTVWRKKLSEQQLTYPYHDSQKYLNMLPAYTQMLEEMQQRITRCEQQAEQAREQKIQSASYDSGAVLLLNNVPRQLKQHGSDKIDQEEAENLQSALNAALPSMQKIRFSILSRTPAVKLEAHKNKLTITVETLSEKDILPGMLKLFGNDPKKIEEALSNGKAGVLSAVQTILKQRYSFLKDSDFSTPTPSRTR